MVRSTDRGADSVSTGSANYAVAPRVVNRLDGLCGGDEDALFAEARGVTPDRGAPRAQPSEAGLD